MKVASHKMLYMKKSLLMLVFISVTGLVKAQVTVGANTAPPAGAMLEIKSNGSKGILLPRVTDTTAVTNPVQGLQVYATNDNKVYVYSNKWQQLLSDGTGWLLQGNANNGGSNSLGYTDSADLVLITNNAERMRLTGNGKLGIGTQNPTERIHLYGNQKIKGALLFGDSAKAGGPVQFALGDPLGWEYSGKIPVNILINDSVSGNFKYPEYNWVGDIISGKTIKHTGGSSDAANVYNLDMEPVISSQSTGAFSVAEAAFQVITNLGSGNIGTMEGAQIGAYNSGNNTVNLISGVYASAGPNDFNATAASTNHTDSLWGLTAKAFPYKYIGGGAATVGHIKGVNVFTGAHAQSGAAASVGQNYSVYINTPLHTGTIGSNYGIYIQNQHGVTAGSNYALYYAGVSPFTVKSDGNVGIGTATPGAKLEVNGTIKATSINFSGLATYPDDAAAGSGGLVSGDMYKTATGELRIKL